MSHGLRYEDLAWQAYQAGAGSSGSDADHERLHAGFIAWWAKRKRQACAVPACPMCGFDPLAIVSAVWTFGIDRETPSLNDRIFNDAKCRGRIYRKERDIWCWEFRNIRLLKKIPKATLRRRVKFTRWYTGRQKERDVDNLVGGGKIAVDAMVLEGLIRGDAPADAEIHWTQQRGSMSELAVLLEDLA